MGLSRSAKAAVRQAEVEGLTLMRSDIEAAKEPGAAT